MRSIVLASLKFRVLIAAAAIAVLAVGALQIRKMPVEVLPDFTPTTVEVQTEALGLSAAEVEQLITVPIEQDLLNGVAFVRDIQSESVPGLSRILMVFQPGTDVFKARQVVAERLTQTAALPQVSKPPRMLQPLSSTNRVLVVGMSSKTLSLMQLGVLARWTIAPRLVGVRGVSNISIWGQEDRQLQVQVDPKRLHAKGVGLDQVIETSANALWVSPLTFVEASTPGTGGFIDTANQRLGIQHESPIKTPADLAKVRVEGTKGRDLTLGDISTVTESHQPLIGQAVVNGRPGLLLVVQRLPGTNVLDVTRNLERTLDDMKPGLAGIEFDTSVYRPATYIETSIDNVRLAALAALALLALAFLALLFRWRTAVIGLVVVPLSVVSAALVLWAFGATMNAIVLTGLVAALVIVIDDAVVSIDSTTRELGRCAPGDSPESAEKAVLRAVLGVSRPTLYATLIIGLSVVPVFFLTRTSGAFFPDLAAAYLLALVVSFVVALAVAPALSLLLLSRGGPDQAPPIVRRLQGRYEAALSRIVGRSAVAYVAILALVALGGASIFLLGRSMLPTFHESQLLVRWDGPAAASLPEMNRITARASRELRAVPGVRGVGGHLGRAVTGDQIVGASSGELWVNVDPGANYDSTVAAVKRVAAEYPGLADRVETYSQAQTDAALGGTGSDLVVRVYGENLHTLGRQAGRVRQLMSGIDGVAGAHVLLPREEPTIQVRVDIDRADRYGLKPGDIRRSATTLLSGLVVGSLFEQEKVFDVVVWGTPQIRSSLTSVRNLLIDTPTGAQVRLGDVASVRIAASPNVIRRQAVSRYVDVAASISGRSRGAVAGDIRTALAQTRFPIEYHAQVLVADKKPAWRLITIAAIAGMLLLLQAFFGSWRLAFLSLLTMPVGAAGGLIAALAVGDKLSFGSYIGLFAILGLSIRGGVLLFDRYRELEQDDGEPFGAQLVVRGARERLVPALVTGVAVTVVFLPVLIMGTRPGLELLHPLAVVTVGGLVTSVPYTLLVLPVLYLRFGMSRAHAPSPAEQLTGVLDELAHGAAAATYAGDVPSGGIVATETRALPPQGGD